MPKTITSNEQATYLALFATDADAIEFETQALSIGDEFMPEAARTVRDGGDATPGYWIWLASQVEVA